MHRRKPRWTSHCAPVKTDGRIVDFAYADANDAACQANRTTPCGWTTSRS